MSKYLNKFVLLLLTASIAIFISCSKGEEPNLGPGNGGGNGGSGDNDTGCVIGVVSQVNSGTRPESSLSAFYNNKKEVTKIVVYDSLRMALQFEAVFNYATTDSVRIDQYRYFLLDGNKRVIRFVSRSNMANPAQADSYQFDYIYNGEGYLIVKNLFINGSAKANFSTSYTYNNNRLTSCLMTCPSAGNLKVLESTLSYDVGLTAKNWLYTFPDAMEGYQFLAILNYGKRVNNPLTRVVTKIYNPATGSLIDTWTTNYGSYKMNAQGFITSGEASGDLQQGIAAFFGKTNFYYTCN